MNEISLPLPEVKSDLKVKVVGRLNTEERPVLSVNLPLYTSPVGCSSEVVTPPRPDYGDLASVVGGIFKRFGYAPPKMSRKHKRGLKLFVRDWCRKNLKKLTNSDILSFDEWLDQAPYSANRKTELRKVWDDCDRSPQWFRWHKVKSFIKDETYEDYKYPRCINSRVDSAKCFWGPYVQAVADRVFSNPWFIKNVPVCDRPEAIKNRLYSPGAEYCFTDYTAYESHFTPEVMSSIQRELFKYMFKDTSHFNNVMRFENEILEGTNICVFKGITVSVKGVRMSGEMDTSLSNGFSNLMLFLYACRLKGVKEGQVVGFVEGDDGLFRVNGPLPTEKDFSDLGFTIKIGTTRNLSEASFCGQVYSMEELVVVTDVKEALCRFGWTNKRYTRSNIKTRMQLLRAKGYSFVYQYNGCPVLSTLGRRILELTHGFEVGDRIINSMDLFEKEKLKKAMESLPEEKIPGPETRYLVEKLYKIDVRTQLIWEDVIRRCTLGRLELPDLEVPKSWVTYGRSYSVFNCQTNPDWLRKDDSAYVRFLKTKSKNLLFKNMT